MRGTQVNQDPQEASQREATGRTAPGFLARLGEGGGEAEGQKALSRPQESVLPPAAPSPCPCLSLSVYLSYLCLYLSLSVSLHLLALPGPVPPTVNKKSL